MFGTFLFGDGLFAIQQGLTLDDIDWFTFCPEDSLWADSSKQIYTGTEQLTQSSTWTGIAKDVQSVRRCTR